jgi:hypothetical protein
VLNLILIYFSYFVINLFILFIYFRTFSISQNKQKSEQGMILMSWTN